MSIAPAGGEKPAPPATDSEFDALFEDAVFEDAGEHPRYQAAPRNAGATAAPSPHSRSQAFCPAINAAAARLQLTDALIQQLPRAAGLHRELDAVIDRLRPALAHHATLAPSWLLQQRHPVRQLLRHWLDSARGWQPELGRGAEQRLRHWNETLGSLTAATTVAEWSLTVESLRAAAAQEDERLARLEERLHAAERGQLRTRRAQAVAARILNQSLGGRRLPPAIAEFIHNEWLQCVQQLLIHHGEHSDVARALTELSQQLVWSLQPQARDEAHRQQLYELVPELASSFRLYLEQTLPDPGRLDVLIGQLETEHLKQLRGQSLELGSCALIGNGDLDSSAEITVGRSLMRLVESLQAGQWFWLEEGERRVRLSLKLEETSQLLFVNALGQKQAICSFEDFAYRLSSGAARPLPGGAALDDLLEELLQTTIAAALTERERLSRELEQVRQAARRRDRDRSKALAEAEAHAEREARAQAQAQRDAQENERIRREHAVAAQGHPEQRERAARQLATAIDIGRWVEFFDQLGDSQRLKLVVKLPSSGKLVFVDRDGGQRLELSRSDFIGRLLEGSAAALEHLSAFDDTLARVVDGLRRERGKRSS